MAVCLKAPIPTIPTLPDGFGFGAVTPAVKLDLTLCCKIPPFPYAIPPIPLGVGVQIPPPILVAIAKAKATLLAYVDKLQINCPRE